MSCVGFVEARHPYAPRTPVRPLTGTVRFVVFPDVAEEFDGFEALGFGLAGRHAFRDCEYDWMRRGISE